MLNYLHKSPKWPKSITTFRYVVNTSPPVPQCPAADTGPSLIRWINISRHISGHIQQILHLNQGFVQFTTSALCSPVCWMYLLPCILRGWLLVICWPPRPEQIGIIPLLGSWRAAAAAVRHNFMRGLTARKIGMISQIISRRQQRSPPISFIEY